MGARIGILAVAVALWAPAERLKPLGDVAGQFGKNHLGNLYHLNAKQEPETPDDPKAPAFKKR